jgi:inosine/xanthosine triphosphate pyrophosphatase family protein
VGDDARWPIVAATRNPDKLARLGRLVGPRYQLLPLPDGVAQDEPGLDDLLGVDDPLVMTATAKAVSASDATGGAMAIATDGGLVIPALGDLWQPALTRRFAGANATNRQRAEALLSLAAGLVDEERRVHWREAVAVARAGRVLMTAVAESHPGRLTTDLTGWTDDGQGFWIHRLWSSGSGAGSGSGDEHWERLTAIVRPFLDGLTGPAGIAPSAY